MTTPNTPANGGQILTDERIAQLNREAQDQAIRGVPPSIYLARALEADLRAALAAPAIPTVDRNAVLEEAVCLFDQSAARYGEASLEFGIDPETRNMRHLLRHELLDVQKAIRALKSSSPVAQPAAQGAVSEDHTARGTFACPICGHDEPHGHSDAIVAAYRGDQIRDDGWISAILRQPKESGWYLCSGVEVEPSKDDSQISWFIWVRDFMRRSSKDIAEVLYWDQLDKNWYLRNALGNAVYSGQENRRPVAAIPRLWCEIPAVKDRAIPVTAKTAEG